jgi:hypothetical protein
MGTRPICPTSSSNSDDHNIIDLNNKRKKLPNKQIEASINLTKHYNEINGDNQQIKTQRRQ